MEQVSTAQLTDIEQKVEEGRRISDAEAVWLYRNAPLHELGRLANRVKERKNGRAATYIINRFINYSNICILDCKFCSFARRKRDEDAFEYSVAQILEMVKQSALEGITEVHIVGGLHPSLPFEYYTTMLRELKKAAPQVSIKAFTAIEIRHLAARVAKKSIRETLEILHDAGLEALTGGGAEIFDQAVRDQICKVKETADEWLEVHREWHLMGHRSTCTMLYGHVESIEQRVDHLRRLRELQDETGGFTALIPYVFEPAHNQLSNLKRISALEELRTLALCRIYLDNFAHLTAYWISMGLPLASVSLDYGVDDLHGTIVEEKIFHMAGAKTPMMLTVERLEKAIRETGREALQRDTTYQHLVPA